MTSTSMTAVTSSAPCDEQAAGSGRPACLEIPLSSGHVFSFVSFSVLRAPILLFGILLFVISLSLHLFSVTEIVTLWINKSF
jgi:hypothetical protein